jgi:hypothetical protein
MKLKLPLSRRSFLGWGALFTGSAVLPSFKINDVAATPDAPVGPPTDDMVFLTESGEFKKDGIFIIGALLVKNHATHEAAFQGFRTGLGYRTKLTYRSTDKYKKGLTDMMTGHFANTPDMKFVAKVIQGGSGPVSAQSWGQRAVEKIPIYNSLIAEVGGTPANIIVKAQSPYGPSPLFRQQFQTGTTFSVLANNTYESNLLQFAGVLTGCARIAANGGAISNKLKIAVFNVLKHRLNVVSITVGTDIPGKFKIMI